MNAARPAEILRQLEQTGAPDRDLLARFVASRDSAAFAELVRRHGPLVLGVCRRVTGQAQDAEDAFQATFLVLAKKAGSLRNPELLGNYLYGVAFRVASRARRSALRRGKREVLVSALPDPQAPSPPPAMPELTPILDEELAALPACYRDAIILCDLRGQSREVAAAALGVPEGTLSSRLANGRKKLAARLTRRGVTLSAALLPVVMQEAQAQTVSNELIAKTCGLVANWAGGGAVPTPLSRLAEGGFTVRKVLVIGVLMAASVAGAVFAATPRDETPPADPPKPPMVAAAKPADAPQPKGEVKPDGKEVTFTSNPRMRRMFDVNLVRTSIRWNATGTHIAVQGDEYDPPDAKKSRPVVWLFGVGERDERRALYPEAGTSLVGVTPDGSRVITDIREYQLISGHHQLKWWGDRGPPPAGPVFGPLPPRDVWIVLKSVDLDLPETHGYAFASDGKAYRTVAHLRDASGDLKQLEVLDVDAATGKLRKSLLKVDYGSHVMSANGKRLVVMETEVRYAVYDLDRGMKLRSATLIEPVKDAPPLQKQPTLRISPDGRFLLVLRGIGRVQVVNADAGVEMPPLEGGSSAFIYPDGNAFSDDGRLMAAAGQRYKITTKQPGDGAQKEPSYGSDFLCVWDTQTGKAVKVWDRGRGHSTARVAFNPTRPLLAILEANGDSGTRVGFWDFAAEVEKK